MRVGALLALAMIPLAFQWLRMLGVEVGLALEGGKARQSGPNRPSTPTHRTRAQQQSTRDITMAGEVSERTRGLRESRQQRAGSLARRSGEVERHAEELGGCSRPPQPARWGPQAFWPCCPSLTRLAALHQISRTTREAKDNVKDKIDGLRGGKRDTVFALTGGAAGVVLTLAILFTGKAIRDKSGGW